MDVDKKFLAKANEKLKDKDVISILKWAKKTYGAEVAMTTAFGYSGMALLDHVMKVMPDMKIYFIDTGFHFKETLDFCDQIKKEWDSKFCCALEN